MKRHGRPVAAIAVVTCLLLALLGVLGQVRRQSLMRDISDEELLSLLRSSGLLPKESEDVTVLADTGPSPETPALSDDANPARDDPSELAAPRIPSREQRLEHLAGPKGLKGTIEYTWLRVLQSAEPVFWLAGLRAADRYAPDIAWYSARSGDLENSRRYMLRALQTESDPRVRRYICSQLAWLEDSPETATVLLEAACSANGPVELRNAIEYAQATGNATLEQRFRQREAADYERVIIYRSWLGAL